MGWGTQEGAERGAPRSVWRLERWVPAVYALFSALWIASSDLLVAAEARSIAEQAKWSLIKGFGFVAVTTLLLHAGLRWAVTRERRALRRVEASEALLRTITDSIPDPVFAKDRKGLWRFANLATLAAVGKRAEEVLGRTDREIFDDQRVAEALMETDQRIMESGLAEVVEEKVQTPTGECVFLSTKAPYRDSQGRVMGIVGSARDITDRTRAEEALREQLALKDQLAKIAASVPGLICSFRLSPRGTACMPFTTPAVEDLYGLSQEALAQDVAPWAANVHPEDLPRVNEAVAQAARTMSRWHDLYRYRHPKKGLRWLEGWAEPKAEADGGVIWHGFLMDVTERVRLEETLLQSQKLESIGQLAGGIAHDFNNLLTVILGCAEALKQDLGSGAPSPANLEDVNEIRAAGERARDLTRKLLTFARRQVIEPVPLDLNALVRDSEKLLRRLLTEDIALVATLQPGLWTTCCDPAQVEQIILNLTVNARDAMPDGGKLIIETSNYEVEGLHAELFPGLRPGLYVRLAIHDSGVGMAPEVKARLFEPFFTTKGVDKGTGLGLATVYGIVKQGGGFIRAESEPGYGSTFEVLFPRIADEAPKDAKPAPTRSTQGSESVLIVEDDPQVREVTTRSLRSAGYAVLVARDGVEALDLLAKHHLRLDLLVTDVIMPNLDGRQLADAVRKQWPGLRVLFVSGHAHELLDHRGVLAAGVDLLPKPYTPASLLARVRESLDRNGPSPARSAGEG